jgi:hypothetical protein
LLFLYELVLDLYTHAGQLCIICGQVITPIRSRLWFVERVFGRHIMLGPSSTDAREQRRWFTRRNPRLRRSPTPTGFAEVVSDDFPVLRAVTSL